jgi:hypothetical protein
MAFRADPAPTGGVRARDVVVGVLAGAVAGTLAFAFDLWRPVAFLYDQWVLPLALVGAARLIEGTWAISARLLVWIATGWYALLSVEFVLFQLYLLWPEP